MHVNTEGLRSGANRSYTAADHAYEGTGRLSRAGISSGIFGDFPAAANFEQAVDRAHRDHIAIIKAHCDKLGTVADKAHSAASDFDSMEEQNRDRLKAVGDSV